ncbi:tetratricopeptide repeat protein [Xanthomarina sp. GH4-25]|uniref:tetratricopeptide repeat protein n=1 Tax=Xanthomarina sp. GH4-25 TaxID=3349335 RepID=UPI003877DCC7
MDLDKNMTQEELAHIERYINNNLTFEELSIFEEKLKNNPDFKNQVEDIKTLLFGIEKQALKEQLDTFHKDIPIEVIEDKKQPKFRFLNFKKTAVAAAVIIALGSFWYTNRSTPKSVFAKHYTPDPGLPTTMSSSDNFIFYDAMVNYKRKDYLTAISKWQPLLLTKPDNDTLNYFIGSAYLADGKEKEAIPYLKKVTLFKEETFKNDAFYYLGLAYLKVNNVELAKKNLNFSTIDNSKDILSELED